MLYKWTDRRRKTEPVHTRVDEAETVHTDVPPTFFLNEEPTPEWTNPSRQKKKAKRSKKRPGHIPAYDEWPELESEHRAMLAEQARERVRVKRRAKRKRNRDNRWFRNGN
jgi:hypothetical protein